MQNDDRITLTRSALEDMLERASEAGSLKALHTIGLHDAGAVKDIIELRDLLETWRSTKRTVLKTVVSWVTVGILALIVAGAAAKTWTAQ